MMFLSLHSTRKLVITLLLALPLSCPARADAQHTAAQKLQSLTELGKQPPVTHKLDIQSWKTREGAKVLFVATHELPMMDLNITFAAGSSRDGDHPGLASLTNALLNEGVDGMDTTAIAAAFENLGARFGNGSYRDMAIASLRTLIDPSKREPALKLFAQVVGNPTTPEAALIRIKNQLLDSFEAEKKDPGALAGKALYSILYSRHPYGHSSDGTAQSIPLITRQQILDFHRKAYAAGNAVIALVGDLSRSEAEAIAQQVSSALPTGPELLAVTPPKAPNPQQQHITFPSQQTHLLMAQLAVKRDDPDYPALFMGNQVFGGSGFGSRLMTELREKRGLTYGVYSGFSPMQEQGPFTISIQTRAEMTQGVQHMIQTLFNEFLDKGPTEKELADAKQQLAGSYPLSIASNGSIVQQLGAIGFYDLPLDQLERFMTQAQAVTVQQVYDAMRRHLKKDAFVQVTVGPEVKQQPLPPPLERPLKRPSAIPEH